MRLKFLPTRRMEIPVALADGTANTTELNICIQHARFFLSLREDLGKLGLRMKIFFFQFLFFSLFSLVRVKAAVTFAQADSVWFFDNGVLGGTATNTQIIDSTGNHTVNSTNLNGLTWSAAPAVGPYGATPINSPAHALTFTPLVTIADPTGVDTVRAATYTVNNGTVSGSATVVTRMMWNGPISNLDDGTNQWILNNGLQGYNESTLSSGGFLFGLTVDGKLYYYTPAAGTGQTPTGATHTYSDTIALSIGQWYDVAMVIDDLGTPNDTTGRVTFYIVGPDGVFQTFTSPDNRWVGNTSATTLIVGSESAGTGNNNQRKTFNGALDYLAIYDFALSEEDVRALFATPEPSRALLIFMSLVMLGLRRGRHSLRKSEISS